MNYYHYRGMFAWTISHKGYEINMLAGEVIQLKLDRKNVSFLIIRTNKTGKSFLLKAIRSKKMSWFSSAKIMKTVQNKKPSTSIFSPLSASAAIFSKGFRIP